MRKCPTGILAITVLLLSAGVGRDAVLRARQTATLPMPCLQLVDERAVRAAVGDGFALASASSPRPGESQCAWEDARATPTRRLGVAFVDRRGFPEAARTPTGAYDASVAALTKTGMTMEPIAGLGEEAARFAIAELSILLVRRSDGVVRVYVINVTHEQAIAVVRRAIAAPSPALGTHATFPEPAPVVAAMPMILAPVMRAWPCVRVLPTADVRSLKREDVLVDTILPRPGYSACEWRATSADETGFRVAIATGEEFADARVANAAGYFAAERTLLNMADAERLSGLGVEALFKTGMQAVVLVRTATAVLTISCYDCSREQIVALARLATTGLGAASAARETPPAPTVAPLPMPCLQLVDEGAVKAAVGARFTPTATEVVAGDSSCMWWEDGDPTPMRTFHVNFMDRRVFVDKLRFPTAVPTAAGIYDAEVSAFTEADMKLDPIAGVGERAAAFTLGTTTILFVLRPDGLVRVMGDLPRPQLIALARQAAAAPAPAIGIHTSFPEPETVFEVGPMEIEPAMRTWPCLQLLPEAKVRSLKRAEVLVDAIGPRPGFTSCEWRTTTSKYTGFIFSVAGQEVFADGPSVDATAFMAAERRSLGPVFRPEPLTGLGDEAIAFLVAPNQPMVMVRRGAQVLTINCFDCSREQAIALARLSAAR